jgi:hypothetical protein
LPNPVLEPLLVPTLPVSWDIPELLTEPSVENSTNLAVLPKLGAWANIREGNKKSITALKVISIILLIIKVFKRE